MNTNMYENPIVQDNLKILQGYGYGVVDPAVGYLACGDTGAGKMVEPDVLLDVILQEISRRPYDDYKKCKTFFELDIFRRAKKYKFAWSLHKAVELKIQIPDKYKWMAYRMGLIA